MDLLFAFREYISKEQLFQPGDRLLVAVSGGLDSAVLCELVHRARLSFTIAHCNFQLRGDESGRDEAAVRQLAERYGCELLVRRFDTAAHALQQGQSVQVAARELRYGWFQQIVDEWGDRSFIVTAHHLDDNIETSLMNFFKGTGIAGLRGMLPRQGKIVRPLLFAGRADLERFAEQERLNWVEDSSNFSDKYTRNYFRHQVIPLIEKVYPAALRNVGDNISRFREIEQVYRQAIERQKKKLLEYKDNEIHIPVLKLKQATPLLTLVYEIFSPYGFSPQQAAEVAGLLDSGTGRYVRSATHRVLRHRGWLILSPLCTTEAVNILVEAPGVPVRYAQGLLQTELLPAPDDPTALPGIPAAALAEPTLAWLDAAQVSWPLLLRPWRQGDYFYPLGMRKKKKLARFFIDNKLSRAEKEKIWVVEMDKKIIWVVGWRIDDRFRITPGTREVLKISYSKA